MLYRKRLIKFQLLKFLKKVSMIDSRATAAIASQIEVQK